MISEHRPARALVLFDIDGTLVRRAGPHHRQALVEAVRRVTGLETSTDHIPVHGMLDPDILTRMLADAGAPPSRIAEALPKIIPEAESIYLETCPALTNRTCPGVRCLLEDLRRHGVLLALVTGNLTRIGWRKLERAGLKRYFRYGAFGEMAPDRSGLATLAVRHARRKHWIRADTPIALIGDAPSDIIAARANRILSVAVATGISTADELRAHGPDLLLRDLRAFRLQSLTQGFGA